MSEFIVGRRELYILPTRIGWYYSLILIALFAIAVKFDNQAAFMMLFVLASIGMVAMLYTHNNVISLALRGRESKPVFVGEVARFPITVTNNNQTKRRAVWLVCDGFHRLLSLDERSETTVALELRTMRRGYFSCQSVILTSQYPLGIFFCWTKRFTPKQRCLVYPQPLDLLPFPESGSKVSERMAVHNSSSNSDDYNGMKPYQAGDRLRDIHWPSLAKTQKLVTIQHQAQSGDSVNLSWFSLPSSMLLEDRLSQLCQWIITAEDEGLRYQLEMPNHSIEFDHGLAHFHQCLSTLALWEER